jgi:hypothetical protein
VGPGGVPLAPGADSSVDDTAAAEGGRHCSAEMTTCQGHEDATTKQKNKMQMYAALLDIDPEDVPNHAQMSKDEANAWLAARWDAHMAAAHPRVGKALFNMTVTHSCAFEKQQYFTTHCPGRSGRLSALSIFLCKSVFYGVFVWARRARTRRST